MTTFLAVGQDKANFPFSAEQWGLSINIGMLQPPVVAPETRQQGRTVPFLIGKDEVYYWSSQWQEGVHEATAALMEGHYEKFDSDDPADAAKWLLADDE